MIAAAWPTLPTAIRMGIVVMVQSSAGREDMP